MIDNLYVIEIYTLYVIDNLYVIEIYTLYVIDKLYVLDMHVICDRHIYTRYM